MIDVEELIQKINDIVKFIQTRTNLVPQLGIILGSGLGGFAQSINNAVIIPYADIPHLPHATAPGHAGNLIIGEIGGKNVIAMQGRIHLYEGNLPNLSTILIRVMKKLGVKDLIISCATGGLNPRFRSGDIMLIEDHINLTGISVLTGPNLSDFGPRFPVMFDVYNKQLGQLAEEIAMENNIYLQHGVLAGCAGPQYCTRAELKYFTLIGGDAVGMSGVQEVITAAHCGLRIVGFAAITDMVLPYAEAHATEQEVIESGKLISVKFKQLISTLIERIDTCR